ncbi:MAG: AmmeMemoRadiSam system protein B [Candidatus Latescibacteria bacterium]|nr:AmmeMemoRadiSam system protein B [Candidatus Latescibacterota bacterium]
MKEFLTLFLIMGAFGLLILSCRGEESTAAVRPPAVAGSFYPDLPSELKKMVQEFLSRATEEKIEGQIVGLLSPHAGYVFCGQVAACSYNQLKGREFDDVIVIGPSHYLHLDGASVGSWDYYQTPLGKVEVDMEIVEKLKTADPKITFTPAAHSREHAVEVQLPFLQCVLGNFKLVPIIMGNPSSENCRMLSNALVKAIGNRKVLLVASSDMSHYPCYEDACRVDRQTLKVIESLAPLKLLESSKEILSRGIPNLDCTLCGLGPVATVLMTAKRLGATDVRVLKYSNSGDVNVMGRTDRNRVVGYSAAVVYKSDSLKVKEQRAGEEFALTKEQKATLLRIARKTLDCCLKKEKMPDFQVEDPVLRQKRGVFVTLTNQGRLRGCIGHFAPDTPLYKLVSQMTIAAATQDYRFFYNPITVHELPDIRIEISVLSPLKKIESIDEIRMGVDGIYVKMGNRAGTFLPQVATETGWSRVEFVERCCSEKAGLPRDAWKRGAELYTYTALVFHEPAEK